MSKESYAALQRLKAIEILAYWEGRLITNQLVDLFGVSRQRASSDIKHYLEKHNPHSLKHNPAVKAYVPSYDFSLVLTSGRINEYLALVADLSADRMAVELDTSANVVALQVPDRSVKPEVVRGIVSACRNGHSLAIQYASINHPVPHERIISPHTLVSTGFRWHVRAYCHTRKAFRDFILSRIEGAPIKATVNSIPILEDHNWNDMITVSITPNNRLNEAQKCLIEKDYAMSNGELSLNVRKALVHYCLQRYQAAITEDETTHVSKYPVQLKEADREKLSPYLFGGEQ